MSRCDPLTTLTKLEKAFELDPYDGEIVRDLFQLYSQLSDNHKLKCFLNKLYGSEEITFDYFFPELHSYQNKELEKAYPGSSLRRIYKELKSIFAGIIYSPVWNGSPATIEEWKQSKFSLSSFEWIIRNSGEHVPELYTLLINKVESLPNQIPLSEAFKILNEGLLIVSKRLNEKYQFLNKTKLESKISKDCWFGSFNNRQEKILMEKFCTYVENNNFYSVLLHGSLADGLTELGYSDFDVTYIIKIPQDASGDELFGIATNILESNTFLLSYNPFMHHGPMINFEDELNWATEALFPSVLVENGIWIKNPIAEVAYLDDGLDYITPFSSFETFFTNRFNAPDDFKNPFDIIWWSSSIVFLPLLLVQMFKGKSIWKRDLFNQKSDRIPEKFWEMLKDISLLRENTAKFIRGKVTLPIDLEFSGKNPGQVLKYYKENVRIRRNDITTLGITDELISSAKEFSDYINNCVFYFHHHNRLKKMNRIKSLFTQWPGRLTEIPKLTSMKDYEETRTYFLKLCEHKDYIVSVYEFGNVGCPGLSDLDLLVVLNDSYRGTPKELMIENMEKKYADIFNHDPLFVGEKSMRYIGAVFPMFNAKKIFGKKLEFKFSKEFSLQTQISLFTFLNLLKYPRDIFYLANQPEVRWKTFLAYLNSFKYIATIFNQLKINIPESINECLIQNDWIRNEFKKNNISIEHLQNVLFKMIAGSAEMILIFESLWANLFPELKEMYGLTDGQKYLNQLNAVLTDKINTYPKLPAILNVLMLHLQKSDDKIDIPSKLYNDIEIITSEYMEYKNLFIEYEISHNRFPNPYIIGGTFSTVPDEIVNADFSPARVEQLQSSQFEWFMFKLNAFAQEHSLRKMLNWSKVWEYPWIWFSTLQNKNFNGKVIIDLGSEISPVPWILALKGAKVFLIETDPQYIPIWENLNKQFNVNVEWRIVTNEIIPLPDNTADIVTSFSVIEHQPDKSTAVDEVIRVLKPDGVFALSFDICQPEMGMTFPEWNGQALTIAEFESIVWGNPSFNKLHKPQWNINEISNFWKWHVQTAKHHNYITAAAVLCNKKHLVNCNDHDSERIHRVSTASFNTPVLFLIYNRPENTQRVFSEIRKAKPKKLYIAADGPKTNNDADLLNCKLTREAVKHIDWDCRVKTLFRETNLGCKIAVSTAINWFFKNEERGIILEDDILPTKSFFQFCEEMLERYANDNRIIHITGNNLQFGWRRNDNSYYFSLYGSIWGWATWRRAWQTYDVDMKKYPKFLEDNLLYDIYGNEAEVKFRKETFDLVYSRNLDTWDFQWAFSRLANNGLSIVPTQNLIKNIGFGKEATHTTAESDIRANLTSEDISFPLKHPDFILRDKISDDRYFRNILTEKKEACEKPGEYNMSLNYDFNNSRKIQNSLLHSPISDISELNKIKTEEIKKIIFLRTDSIGDNVLASSMLPYIHEKYRNAKITVVCQEHIAELYEVCPFVDNIIHFNRIQAYQDEKYRVTILQHLRAIDADIALNSVYSREPLTDAFTIGSNAKERLAFNGNLCNISNEIRDKHNQLYTKIVPSSSEHKPEIERHRDFLRGLGIDTSHLQPIVWITPENEQFAEEFFCKNNLSSKKTIALFAGAQGEIRFYRQYGTALSQICKDNQFTILAFGTEREQTINQQNLDDIGSQTINLSGKTTLRQTAALLKRCALAVGAETGTAHIACAVGTPNVILLGGGHFGRFMPYSPLTSVVCLPLECYGCNWSCKYQTVHCVKDIRPEVIEKAVRQTLENKSKKPRVFVQGSSLWNPQTNQPQWQWFNGFLDSNSVEIIPVGDVPPLAKTEIKIPDVTSQQSVELFNLEAKQELKNGNISRAKELLSKILEQSPNNIKALNNLAVTNILGKNWESATDILQKVLKLDPSNKIAPENIKYLEMQQSLQKSILEAENFIESKQYTQAREILEKVVITDDKHTDALNNLAVINILERNFESARYFLEKVLSIDNANEIALENIACINRNRTSYSSAIGNESSVKIDVSIIIATKDRAKLLDEMLTSLIKATPGINYEVIVMEGNSSDNTLEILHKHGIKKIYNETVYLGKGKHSWPQLYNFGFTKAQGKWAMYASDDINFNAGCISKAVELLDKQNPEVAGGVFFYKNVFAEPGWDRFGIDFTYGQKLLMNYGLVRLDYFREVNGFDENYKFYCADGDLCLKFYEKGKQLIPLPGCFVVHNNVMDNQKKSNLNNSAQDIELYIQTWKHFVTTKTPEPRRLLWNESGPDNSNLKERNNVVLVKDIRTLVSASNTLDQLLKAGGWNDGQPLRLHLGCGEQHLDDYVNIDFPPSEHNVMNIKADMYADITKLNFPTESVDEIRLHHVFEHFNRVTALALLIKWHNWLKIGGKLHIETPDLVGSAKTLLGKYSWKTKMGVVRHIAGDQSSSWAYHIDHWFPERFEHTLSNLGFRVVQTQSTSWPHEPFLSNVTTIAVKSQNVSLTEQLKAADALLWESTVASTEQPTFEVWKQQLRSLLSDKHETVSQYKQLPFVSQIEHLTHIFRQSVSEQPIEEIHDFNQRDRDRWVSSKALTVPAGSRVLDIGAGTCPYRALFTHCDYKTHDFEQYTGEKLGGTTEYGKIDYESDICAIPVPDNSFDVILCTEVLEHTPEPIEAMREMSRILRPGGRLFVTAPLGSGLHQLPYHYYGGYTPEWHKHFCTKFGLCVTEISPNGGFFKLLAQECARVAWTLPQHQQLHGNNVEFIRNLFGEWIPRYLFALEEKHFIDQFTVGYHVEAMKVRDINTVQKMIEKNTQNVNLYIEAARSLMNQGKFSNARMYVEDALELNYNNSTLLEMYQQLTSKP